MKVNLIFTLTCLISAVVVRGSTKTSVLVDNNGPTVKIDSKESSFLSDFWKGKFSKGGNIPITFSHLFDNFNTYDNTVGQIYCSSKESLNNLQQSLLEFQRKFPNIDITCNGRF